MRAVPLVALLSLTAALCACGQKGPLYLRGSPPPGVKPEKPEAYRPIPYPAQPAREEAREAEPK